MLGKLSAGRTYLSWSNTLLGGVFYQCALENTSYVCKKSDGKEDAGSMPAWVIRPVSQATAVKTSTASCLWRGAEKARACRSCKHDWRQQKCIDGVQEVWCSAIGPAGW
jgi:hypothetical protein